MSKQTEPVQVEVTQMLEQIRARVLDHYQSCGDEQDGFAMAELDAAWMLDYADDIRTTAFAQGLERIDLALQAGTTRYTHTGHEEDWNKPGMPYEVVFTMPEWEVVLRALARQAPPVRNYTGEPTRNRRYDEASQAPPTYVDIDGPEQYRETPNTISFQCGRCGRTHFHTCENSSGQTAPDAGEKGDK